jgi:hypothetical protein
MLLSRRCWYVSQPKLVVQRIKKKGKKIKVIGVSISHKEIKTLECLKFDELVSGPRRPHKLLRNQAQLGTFK